MLNMCDFRYEPWPELKWLLDSFLPRFAAAATSVAMEQDEEEVAECDKVWENIFFKVFFPGCSYESDQFPLSKIIIFLIAKRADKQQ